MYIIHPTTFTPSHIKAHSIEARRPCQDQQPSHHNYTLVPTSVAAGHTLGSFTSRVCKHAAKAPGSLPPCHHDFIQLLLPINRQSTWLRCHTAPDEGTWHILMAPHPRPLMQTAQDFPSHLTCPHWLQLQQHQHSALRQYHSCCCQHHHLQLGLLSCQ